MTERRHRGRQLVLEMRTKATPEQVYEAWADPEKLAHWFVDSARGKAEVGSIFTWVFEKFGYEIPYEVVAAEPGRRFALAGEAPRSGPFLLEVSIAREGGETLVTLVNSGFLDGAEWDEEFEGIVSGWTNALAVLKHYLENYAGRKKTSILVMHPATCELSNLLPFYSTAEGLDRWLTTSASIGDGVGAPCALRLPGGDSLTGRLLSKTRWETAISWQELDGVLELKGFRFPGTGQVVAARVVSWNLTSERAAAIERLLQEALAPLAAAVGTGVGSPAGAPDVIGQAVSLVGAAMILAAFAGQQAGKLGREDLAYLLLNLAGSVILTYFAYEARNAGLTALEGSWALISLYSLWKRRSSPRHP